MASSKTYRRVGAALRRAADVRSSALAQLRLAPAPREGAVRSDRVLRHLDTVRRVQGPVAQAKAIVTAALADLAGAVVAAAVADREAATAVRTYGSAKRALSRAESRDLWSRVDRAWTGRELDGPRRSVARAAANLGQARDGLAQALANVAKAERALARAQRGLAAANARRWDAAEAYATWLTGFEPVAVVASGARAKAETQVDGKADAKAARRRAYLRKVAKPVAPVAPVAKPVAPVAPVAKPVAELPPALTREEQRELFRPGPGLLDEQATGWYEAQPDVEGLIDVGEPRLAQDPPDDHAYPVLDEDQVGWGPTGPVEGWTDNPARGDDQANGLELVQS